MTKSKISQAIEGNSVLVFKPKKEFYQQTKINPKRWGLLYRGEKELTFIEARAISDYFNIELTALY